MLLRAGEVVDGRASSRASAGPVRTDRDLARGPARLCRALGIDLADNGVDLTAGPVTLTLGDAGRRRLDRSAGGAPRRARPAVAVLATGDPTVSTYRPAAPCAPDEASLSVDTPDLAAARGALLTFFLSR